MTTLRWWHIWHLLAIAWLLLPPSTSAEHLSSKMNPKLRAKVLNMHNLCRSIIASGNLFQPAPKCSEKLPCATHMQPLVLTL